MTNFYSVTSRIQIPQCAWVIVFFLLFWHPSSSSLFAQEDESSPSEWKITHQANPRFTTIDVMIDPGNQPLAAYQVEIKTRHGKAQIVGIEGGSHAAYEHPPYYDPKALQKNRVILAAYNTEAPESLPRMQTRVATLHVYLTGPKTPEFSVNLSSAANPQGTSLKATASLQERKR